VSSCLRRRDQAEPNHPDPSPPGWETSVGSGVETFQNPWELSLLVNLVDRLRPEAILEVGAMYGGTLRHWLWGGATRVVVVDDQMRGADAWEAWAGVKDLCLLQGLSQDGTLVQQAAELGPYDFAFIDADHSYDAVLADWRNYGPMTSVIAFHDILPRPGYGVSRLWGELRSAPGARCVEIVHNETLPGNEGPCGIGVLWT